jgi:hypothetical protein
VQDLCKGDNPVRVQGVDLGFQMRDDPWIVALDQDPLRIAESVHDAPENMSPGPDFAMFT